MTKQSEAIKSFISDSKTSTLVDVYNLANTQKPVKKFRDRKTAEHRVAEAIASATDKSIFAPFGIYPEICDDEEQSTHTLTVIEPIQKPKQARNRSQHAGSIIKTRLTSNPRRAGSLGWISFNIVLNAGDDGILFEEYIKQGGRSKDLSWDYDHGYVEIGNYHKSLLYPKHKKDLITK